MIVKQVYTIKNKSYLMISLPENFRTKKQILVVLDDSVDNRTAKLDLMKKACKDPLFIADIDAVSKDFKHIDNDIIL